MTVDNVDLIAETPYIWRARRADSRHRLICFPHAGAGAGAYADWAGLLPPEIELAAVQLPGRQNRIAEDPVTEVGPLVRVLTQALRPVMDGSFSFFGHSGGAILAFELARALQRKGGPQPSHLFLSAQSAPGTTGRVRRLHDLSDDELGAEVVRLGGIEAEIAEDEDVMDALLMTLRADFELWENHRIEPGPRLSVPITVLSGQSDPRAPLDTLDGWREQTDGPFGTRFYPGGHFYFLGEAAELVGHISQTLLAPQMAGRTS
ncbi:thioesterase [Streptomyces lunaelactis]|uniref:thioesterase II family protein n=1 Tax=Streptomyces lunaelactis TaxID=1535768 RepID=UPI001584E13D|nr:thioesterase [Streptomyces lunaelactis]NUK02263.1 thioesterase [Streptomyces lunaelactis]NUK10823.1 thioesterase [Streptomyces lunaelactis]NUK16127.1 thioesterase [Streptomyces lunaelactis]NUK22862.1 thioesterase [Streptomyces lunaelactis]NUK34959.1 thioesterase [Streptomyces lunaelactis]